MSRRYLIVALTAMILAAPAAALGSAGPNNTVHGVVNSPAAGATAGPSPDVEAFAAYQGVSVEQATSMLAQISAFGSLLSTLREGFADKFADAWLEYEPGFTLNVGVVGEPDKDFEAIVAKSGLPVHIVWGLALSEVELTDRTHELTRALADVIPEVPFSVTFDALKGELEVTVPAEETDDPRVAGVLSRKDVAVYYSPGPVAEPQFDVRGGGELMISGTYDCTSGFSVETTTGSGSGIATAGHCRGLTDYRAPGGNTTPLNFQGRHQGAYGDLEWYTTPSPEVDQFYSDFGTTRTVTDVKQPGTFMRSDWFCKFGRTSGYACEFVWRAVADCNYGPPDGYVLDMVAMEHAVTFPGDSGGPWFWNTTAVGIHSGLCNVEGVYGSIFSKANRLPEALGVRVKRE